MPFGEKRTKEEVEKLKESIAILLTQAIPHKQIYTQLNIPHRTFYHYYDELADDFRNDHLKKASRIIYGFGARSMNRVRELQAKYLEEKDYRILEKAQAIEKSIMDLYQDLGILERAPEKITQELTLVAYKEPEWIKKKKGAAPDAHG
jgi:hypothetical protein